MKNYKENIPKQKHRTKIATLNINEISEETNKAHRFCWLSVKKHFIILSWDH